MNCVNCSKELTENDIKNNFCSLCHSPIKCSRCGVILTDFDHVRKQCQKCLFEIDYDNPQPFIESKNEKAVKIEIPNYDIQFTTTSSFPESPTIETLGVITAECAMGMNILKDMMTGLSDIFGGQSKTIQNQLKSAKQYCFDELTKEAYKLKANAIVGLRLDYSEISSQNKSMLMLVASGTAVRVKKKTD